MAVAPIRACFLGFPLERLQGLVRRVPASPSAAEAPPPSFFYDDVLVVCVCARMCTYVTGLGPRRLPSPLDRRVASSLSVPQTVPWPCIGSSRVHNLRSVLRVPEILIPEAP